MNTKKWKSIGTVLGETNISEFYFSLKNYIKLKKVISSQQNQKFHLVREKLKM